MKNKNLRFSSNIGYNTEKYLNKYKTLLLKMIEDDSIDFYNYNIRKDETYLIPVERNFNWGEIKSSYFIFWYKGDNYSEEKYLRIDLNKGLSLGYVYNKESYKEFLIGEDYYYKQDRLMEKNIMKCSGLESFVTSKYVQKHNFLLEYMFWRGTDKCLPEQLYIDFNITGIKNKITIIKYFSDTDIRLKDIKRFIKLFKQEKNK